MNMLVARINKLALLVLILLLSSCLEKEEGCLDPNATNLDVTADVNGNCVYPSMIFSIDHMWGNDVYRENTIIPLDNGDSIAITSFQLYVSDLILGADPQLTVYDSISLNDGGYIKDDLTMLTLDAVNFTSGYVNDYGVYDGLRFALGYEAEWNQVDTALLADTESSHPWLDESMRNEQLVRYLMKVNYDLINQDTLSREISLVGPYTTLVTDVTELSTIQTNNVNVNLVIDYEELIQGIDLRSLDAIGIANSMWSNIARTIQVSN